MARPNSTPDQWQGGDGARCYRSATQPANLSEEFLIGGVRVHRCRQRAAVSREPILQERAASPLRTSPDQRLGQGAALSGVTRVLSND